MGTYKKGSDPIFVTMGRKKHHEDHVNHEAWAIPYGDLITLLLAFFVVMYAISSVNEGKFRVLSDSLNAAFRGNPRTLQPIQVGEKTRGSGADIAMSIVQQSMIDGQPRRMLETIRLQGMQGPGHEGDTGSAKGESAHPMAEQLTRVANELETALKSLVDAELVAIRRHEFWLEVEIRTDILFPSGVANLADEAYPALDALAATLQKYPNPLRVEGHTDNRPINTKYYPSNWELSAARAASVVHRFARGGISPARLSVIGFGEFRPAQSNDTAAGRNANRRVIIVILAGEGAPAPADAAGMSKSAAHSAGPHTGPGSPADDQYDAGMNLEASDAQTAASAPAGAAGTETAPISVTLGTSGGNPTRE